MEGLGLWLSGPLSRRRWGPPHSAGGVRAVADYYGYRPATPVPGVLALASALTSLPDGRVCATTRKGGTCLLTFADEAGVWRLVDFDVDGALRGSGGRPR